MRRLVVFAVALLAGCGMGEPSQDQPVFVVHVLSPAGGSFTATHRNASGAGGGNIRSYAGNGSFQEVTRSSFTAVDTSLQEIRGTFTGGSLVVGFGTRLYAGGSGSGIGASSGSLQSVEGPHLQTLPCQVRYGPGSAAGSTYSVKFRFTADRAKVCADP